MAYLIDREEAKKAMTAAVWERAARADANPLEAQLAVRAYSKVLDDLPAASNPRAEKAEAENARLREALEEIHEKAFRLQGQEAFEDFPLFVLERSRAAAKGGDNG